jgi:tRNA-dihydrouridine synthase
MNFYFAPLEGLTGYIYRNAHHAFFPKGIAKYFSPFIVANGSDSFKTRELNDILPENNQGTYLVPQLLTNNADDFIHTTRRIKLLGYSEINLNLGCPSGTVVSKNRGSGFLAKRTELDLFLEKIFHQPVMKISIKTRIGKDSPEEFDALIEIFNKYPVEELIIHPRVQTDFYKNKPNMEVFQAALDRSRNPVCYNGDIFTAEDHEKFSAGYPGVGTVMLGRGLLMNPGLVNELLYGIKPEKSRLRNFHDTIYEGYKRVLHGEKDVLFKMKELWSYMIAMYSDNAKHLKRIKKAQTLHAYEEAISCLFGESDINHFMG